MSFEKYLCVYQEVEISQILDVAGVPDLPEFIRWIFSKLFHSEADRSASDTGWNGENCEVAHKGIIPHEQPQATTTYRKILMFLWHVIFRILKGDQFPCWLIQQAASNRSSVRKIRCK